MQELDEISVPLVCKGVIKPLLGVVIMQYPGSEMDVKMLEASAKYSKTMDGAKRREVIRDVFYMMYMWRIARVDSPQHFT